MSDLFFSCPACRDRRRVGAARSYCLCGAVSARLVGDTVVLAGPGEIGGDLGGDAYETVSVRRPSPIGT